MFQDFSSIAQTKKLQQPFTPPPLSLSPSSSSLLSHQSRHLHHSLTLFFCFPSLLSSLHLKLQIWKSIDVIRCHINTYILVFSILFQEPIIFFPKIHIFFCINSSNYHLSQHIHFHIFFLITHTHIYLILILIHH